MADFFDGEFLTTPYKGIAPEKKWQAVIQ